MYYIMFSLPTVKISWPYPAHSRPFRCRPAPPARFRLMYYTISISRLEPYVCMYDDVSLVISIKILNAHCKVSCRIAMPGLHVPKSVDF